MRSKLALGAAFLVAIPLLGLPAALGLSAMPGHEAQPARPASLAERPLDRAEAQALGARARTAAERKSGPAFHILQLEDAPLARYRGEIDELPATSPVVTGKGKLDLASPASRDYLAYLESRQAETLRRIEQVLGHPVDVLHRYRYAYNGLAVWLTSEEARRVAEIEGVLQVERSVVDPLATDVGPSLIGAPGIWDGSATGGLPGNHGAGIVAGIIDTGINIDHASFAEVGGDGFQHTNPRGAGNYLGWCNASHPNYDPQLACNAKLIGLYSYPDSSMNPEDEDSHGSHTSSTVAGNILNLSAPTVTLTRTLSGVAPHANIVMYDACAGNGCDSTATVAAIDQAAADGVDVLNYSIAIGRNSPWVNSRLVAFLGAYEAGVFVAASAGNAGNPETVNATAPWITSVAATTHGRSFANALVDLTGGAAAQADLPGAGFTAGYGPAKIILAQGKLRADGTPDDGQCLSMNAADQPYAAPFPPGTFNGEIVVCDRGRDPRVWKGMAVRDGGAGGLILANTAAQGEGIAGDAHFIPAVHLGATAAGQLKAWLAGGADHMGRILGMSVTVDPAQSDTMAAFTSRGPALTGICCRRPNMDPDLVYADLLKPDVGAPGVNIMAAVASLPPAVPPEFGLLSGTSMASPHTAGAGALLTKLHPDWSPSAIQSALMMSAKLDGIRNTAGTGPAVFFDTGAGRVDLSRAGQVGLVLDATPADMEAADPDQGGSPSALNLASMANTRCFGGCSWTRTFKSTRNTPITWNATIVAAPGSAAPPAGAFSVSPASFTVAAGGSQAVQVSADVSALPVNTWGFAMLLLAPADASGGPELHLPIVVRHPDKDIPPAVVIYTDQTNGTHAVTGLRAPAVTALTIAEHGLVKGTTGNVALPEDPTTGDPFDSPAGVHVITLTVGADSRRLVAEVTGSSSPDVDLFVGRDANGNGLPSADEVVCTSGRESWDELCDVTSLQAGTYWVLFQNFKASANPPDSIDFVTAVVPETNAGNMSVSGPASVPAYEPFDLALVWDLAALMPGDRWFGAIRLGTDAANPSNLGTIVVDLIGTVAEVPTPTPVPPTLPPTVPPATPTRTPTPVEPTPTTAPQPSATPGGVCVCEILRSSGVPEGVIQSAVANPGQVSGFQQPSNPSKPVSRFNPLRECLTVQNPASPYHPLFNSLVFRAGCP